MRRQKIKTLAFAHIVFLPENCCPHGCRIHSVTAVTEAGKRFSFTLDQKHYADARNDLNAAFYCFCRENGLHRANGEVWWSSSHMKEFEPLPACPDCSKRPCFYFVDDMLCCYNTQMKSLREEYAACRFTVPGWPSWEEFLKQNDYDEGAEPYEGRRLYPLVSAFRREDYSEEELALAEAFIESHLDAAFADRYRCSFETYLDAGALVSAALTLLEHAPERCKEVISAAFEVCLNKSRDEQLHFYDFLEEVLLRENGGIVDLRMDPRETAFNKLLSSIPGLRAWKDKMEKDWD